MKKVTLLLVLLTIAAFIYAGDAKVEVSGAVKAQWGIDLDYQTTGFKYALDGIQLKVKPATEVTEVKKTGAEGETFYGEISVNGIRLEADNGWNGIGGGYGSTAVVAKWDAFAAKLVLGPLTIGIKDGASTVINYEGVKKDSFWLTNAYDYKVFSNRYGSNDSDQSAATVNSWEDWNQIQFVTPGVWYQQDINAGIVAKYAVPSIVDLALDIASYKSWDDTARHDTVTDNDNAYAGRFTASVTAVPNLTLNLGTNFAVGYIEAFVPDEGPAAVLPLTNKNEFADIALGGRVSYKIDLGGGTVITPGVAADVLLSDPVMPSLTGGVKVEFKGSTVTANAGINLYDWMPLTTAADNVLAYTIAANIGAIDNLILQAAYEAIDISTAVADTETMAIHAKLGYGIAINEKVKVTPSFQMSYDNKADLAGEAADDTDEDLFAKIALDITGLLANTTLSINWDSDDLQNDTPDANKGGQVVFTAKVSF